MIDTPKEPVLLIESKSATTSTELVETVPFPRIPATETCNGKIHRQERYCKKQSGWGTDHFGIGRCKLHGGCSTGPKSGKLRYSECLPEPLMEMYEQFSVESDFDIKSLNDEIAMLRARIAAITTKNVDIKNEEGRLIAVEGHLDQKLCGMVETVRRLIETKQKVEEGKKTHVTIDIAIKTVEQVIMIIDKNVTDLALKKKIAGELRRLNRDDLGLNPLQSKNRI